MYSYEGLSGEIHLGMFVWISPEMPGDIPVWTIERNFARISRGVHEVVSEDVLSVISNAMKSKIKTLEEIVIKWLAKICGEISERLKNPLNNPWGSLIIRNP